MTTKIADQLQSALQTISEAAQQANRSANEVHLLAVSKTKPESMIEQAWHAGHRAFGENYVQEGITKIQNLAHLQGIQWHLIGPLQSNKCKPVAEHFHWVQSVDRLKIAQRLNDNRPEHMPHLNVCIQVNISAEDSKSGLTAEQLPQLAQQIATMPRLRLRGIMAIPSKTSDHSQLAKEFGSLSSLYHNLRQQYDSVDTLSMGMSGDMALAIEHGSTMVRIGTAIFGAREKPSDQ